MKKRLYHPHLKDLSIEVNGEERIAAHVAAGWRKTDPFKRKAQKEKSSQESEKAQESEDSSDAPTSTGDSEAD